MMVDARRADVARTDAESVHSKRRLVPRKECRGYPSSKSLLAALPTF